MRGFFVIFSPIFSSNFVDSFSLTTYDDFYSWSKYARTQNSTRFCYGIVRIVIHVMCNSENGLGLLYIFSRNKQKTLTGFYLSSQHLVDY